MALERGDGVVIRCRALTMALCAVSAALLGGMHGDCGPAEVLSCCPEAAFRHLFVQVVQIVGAAGLVKMGAVGLNGSRIQANANQQARQLH